MTALFLLPAEGELTLTERELAAITGTSTRRLQIEWLKVNSWTHVLTRGGAPVVGRLYANMKLSDLNIATMAPSEPWEPDLSAIS